MKALPFPQQAALSLVLLAAAFLAAGILRAGVIINAGYILCGLLFVRNPIWPAACGRRDRRQLRRGIRAGGIAVIIIFGFCLRCNL